MSFIRSLTNPEGLYIFGDGTNIEFCVRDNPIKVMRPEAFFALMQKFLETDGNPGETLESHDAKLVFDKFGDHFKWRLYNKGWTDFIEMWEVTLESIARSALATLDDPHSEDLRQRLRAGKQ